MAFFGHRVFEVDQSGPNMHDEWQLSLLFSAGGHSCWHPVTGDDCRIVWFPADPHRALGNLLWGFGDVAGILAINRYHLIRIQREKNEGSKGVKNVERGKRTPPNHFD